MIFDSTFSVINWLLKVVGWLGPGEWYYWLGDPVLGMVAIITVHVWRMLPFSTVILLAGLTSIPREVHEAADGEACVASARSLRPDVIFLDIGMPRMSGDVALRQLRTDPSTHDIPVVMLTAQALTSGEREALSAIADVVVTKQELSAARVGEILRARPERVALVASGGMSHFPGTDRYASPDFEYDRGLLEALAAGRGREMARLTGEELDKRGNIELRTWITLLGAVGDAPAAVYCYEPSWHHGNAVVEWPVG